MMYYFKTVKTMVLYNNFNGNHQSYIFIEGIHIERHVSKRRNQHLHLGSGMMTDSCGCLAIPWSHLFTWEWTEEWDREGEGAEVMEGVDEDDWMETQMRDWVKELSEITPPRRQDGLPSSSSGYCCS